MAINENAAHAMHVLLHIPTMSFTLVTSAPIPNPHESCSNKEIQFQYISGWIELHFQDIPDAVYQTSVVINMFSSIDFGALGGAFSSHS